MNAKEKLMKDLFETLGTKSGNGLILRDVDPDKLCNFILADRARIVSPLVKHKKLWCGNWQEYTASEAIDEAIKLSGV